MSELFNRDLSVIVGTLKIATRAAGPDKARPTLRVVFNVSLSLSSDANTCNLSIYNLKKDNRSLLHQSKKLTTIVNAGYVGNAHDIFKGDLEFVGSAREGTDWVTTLQSGDGANKFKGSRINLSFKGPVTLKVVLKKIAAATGLDLGNVIEKADQGSFREALQEFKNGKVLSGAAIEAIKKLAKDMGYGHSVQGGANLLLGPNETLALPAVLLKAGTGLLGSPEPGEDGFVTARSLLQPELLPGRQVKLEAREIDGFFRVEKEKSVFSGDTWGNDWDSQVELKPL